MGAEMQVQCLRKDLEADTRQRTCYRPNLGELDKSTEELNQLAMAMGCPVHLPHCHQLNSQPRVINLQDPLCVTWRARESGVQSSVSRVSGQSCPHPHFLLLRFPLLGFLLFNSSSHVLFSLSASLLHTLPVIPSFPLSLSHYLAFSFLSPFSSPQTLVPNCSSGASFRDKDGKSKTLRHPADVSENTDPTKKSFKVNFLVSLNLSAISQGTFH